MCACTYIRIFACVHLCMHGNVDVDEFDIKMDIYIYIYIMNMNVCRCVCHEHSTTPRFEDAAHWASDGDWASGLICGGGRHYAW